MIETSPIGSAGEGRVAVGKGMVGRVVTAGFGGTSTDLSTRAATRWCTIDMAPPIPPPKASQIATDAHAGAPTERATMDAAAARNAPAKRTGIAAKKAARRLVLLCFSPSLDARP